jgi:hypothetical protein
MGREKARAKGWNTFLIQFHTKASKAQKKGNECFKAQDYINSFAGYFGERYYRVLACAVDGYDHEADKEENGTIVDMLRSYLRFEYYGQGRVTQILKKMGKPDKMPELITTVDRFVDDIAADFMALSKKSTEIYHTLMDMGTWEKIEKGLTHNAANPVRPEDRLFMEDEAIMAIMNRLKAQGNINRLVKEIQKILS